MQIDWRHLGIIQTSHKRYNIDRAAREINIRATPKVGNIERSLDKMTIDEMHITRKLAICSQNMVNILTTTS